MERAHIFIGGTIFLLIATMGIVLGAIHISSSRPEAKTGGEYTTFSSPQNVFSSLQQTDTEQPTTLTHAAVAADSLKQQAALRDIITAWEERPGSSDAREVRSAQVFVDTRTPEEIERQEIGNLFNDLIGTKITDKLAQQSSQTNGSSDTIWTGSYTNSGSGTTSGGGETQTQQALHAYGNELGALLKAFQLAQGDQTKLLETFLEDRNDTEALKRLTDAYITLAQNIKVITAPSILTTTHAGLVDSYTQVGELLWNLHLADSDEALIERMLIYNKASEAVAKHHVTLVTLFKAHGVTFQQHEPGSIFTFSPQTQGSL